LRIVLSNDKLEECAHGYGTSEEGGGELARALRLSAVLADCTRLVQELRRLSFRRWPQSRFYGDLLLHPAPATRRLRARMRELDRQVYPECEPGELPAPSLDLRTVATASHLSAATAALFKLPSFADRKVCVSQLAVLLLLNQLS
jgi:hypothetical protein